MEEKLKGSKPTLPTMDESSRAAGLSMNGMACDTFMETVEADAGRGTARERHTDAPEMAAEKPVTTGATKAIVWVLG